MRIQVTVLTEMEDDNGPKTLHSKGILNTSIPIVVSHGSFFDAADAQLLRSSNQYLSITPESEMV